MKRRNKEMFSCLVLERLAPLDMMDEPGFWRDKSWTDGSDTLGSQHSSSRLKQEGHLVAEGLTPPCSSSFLFWGKIGPKISDRCFQKVSNLYMFSLFLFKHFIQRINPREMHNLDFKGFQNVDVSNINTSIIMNKTIQQHKTRNMGTSTRVYTHKDGWVLKIDFSIQIDLYQNDIDYRQIHKFP